MINVTVGEKSCFERDSNLELWNGDSNQEPSVNTDELYRLGFKDFP